VVRIDGTSEWIDRLAPSLAEFEQIARAAFMRLPARFRDMAGEIVFRIEEFPAEEVLEDMGIDDPYGLLGLYQGVSLDRRSVSDVPLGPSMVFLYRRPILDYWAESEDTLGEIIVHVLVHEIGHHFGLSDDDMAAIEASA
jgi:predicted Zn-dependent protease with MMP-like domain